MNLELVHDDITGQRVDAIVNAANPDVLARAESVAAAG